MSPPVAGCRLTAGPLTTVLRRYSLAWLVGRWLTRLNTERYRREAELRFAIVRVHESAESVHSCEAGVPWAELVDADDLKTPGRATALDAGPPWWRLLGRVVQRFLAAKP